MTELIIPAEAPDLNALKERRVDRIARKALLSLLKKLVHGRITIVENHQRYHFGEPSDKSALQAVITVNHPQLYTRIFFGGSIGAAEAYMEGLWSADDLTTVMRILALNQRAFEAIAPGGILFTFSCSQAVSRENFRKSVFVAAANSGRKVRILHQLSQPPDHPVSIYH